jgi:hypothetical protein
MLRHVLRPHQAGTDPAPVRGAGLDERLASPEASVFDRFWSYGDEGRPTTPVIVVPIQRCYAVQKCSSSRAISVSCISR